MRTTRRERMQRREVALAKVSEGFGFSECVTYVMAQAGCSRATARRDCHWAMDQLAEGLDGHDIQHLVVHLATSLQRISLKAEQAQQFSAAVGSLRLLYDLLLSRRLDSQARMVERRSHHGNMRR